MLVHKFAHIGGKFVPRYDTNETICDLWRPGHGEITKEMYEIPSSL